MDFRQGQQKNFTFLVFEGMIYLNLIAPFPGHSIYTVIKCMEKYKRLNSFCGIEIKGKSHSRKENYSLTRLLVDNLSQDNTLFQ